MSGTAFPSRDVPGWVILSLDALPDAWGARAIPLALVPLTPAEVGQLLSHEPVEQRIAGADLSLIHLVARGHGTAEISRELGISARTVNRRVAVLRDEFGVSTIQELATELARRGF
jgi:DNA-binding CsgD family transcriptional regulator